MSSMFWSIHCHYLPKRIWKYCKPSWILAVNNSLLPVLPGRLLLAIWSIHLLKSISSQIKRLVNNQEEHLEPSLPWKNQPSNVSVYLLILHRCQHPWSQSGLMWLVSGISEGKEGSEHFNSKAMPTNDIDYNCNIKFLEPVYPIILSP